MRAIFFGFFIAEAGLQGTMTKKKKGTFSKSFREEQAKQEHKKQKKNKKKKEKEKPETTNDPNDPKEKNNDSKT